MPRTYYQELIRPLPLSTAHGDISVDLARWETPAPIDWDLKVVQLVPTPFIPGRYPKWEEKRKTTRKHPKVIPSAYLHFQTHTPPIIDTRNSHIWDWVISGIITVVELPRIIRHRWELPQPVSAIAINPILQLHCILFIDILHISVSKKVILTKFKHASTLWALCSASACSTEYILQPVVISTWYWLVSPSRFGSHRWNLASVTHQSTSRLSSRQAASVGSWLTWRSYRCMFR